MRIASHGMSDPSGAADIARLYAALEAELGTRPHLVVTYFTEGVTDITREAMSSLDHEPAVIAASSCQGVMTQHGAFGAEPGSNGVAMMGIADGEGAYGTAFEASGDDPSGAASRALIAAMGRAGRLGELPSLIVMHASPGAEEAVVDALTTATGGHCPIVGGSAADDAIAGNWTTFADGGGGGDGISVAVCYPSTSATSSFQSGYEPAGHRGVVTACDSRTVFELDGRPAAVVYNEWTGGAIDDAFTGDPTVLAQSTMQPLGRQVGSIAIHDSIVPYYTLLHPERVTEEKGLAMFADVSAGDELLLMTGTIDGLVARAGRVVASARSGDIDPAGAIVIYCAGCRLAVDDDLPSVVDSINESLDGAPFIGAFTFGEQGCLLGGENQHGNLMISAGVIER